jgi:hypothetical protein
LEGKKKKNTTFLSNMEAELYMTTIDTWLCRYVEEHRSWRLSGLETATLGSLGPPKYMCRNDGEFCVIDNICVDVTLKKAGGYSAQSDAFLHRR